MIADTKKGGDSQEDIFNYALYMVSLKRDHPDYRRGERVLALSSDNILIPMMPNSKSPKECRRFARKIMQDLMAWTVEKRNGRPMPKSLFQSGSVSFSVADSKRLTPQYAIEITREAVQQVMPGIRQVFYAAHGDTECLHVHFEASSTDENGKIWNPRLDFRLFEKAMESLEIKYKLERVVQRKALQKDDQSREVKVSAPSRKEIEITLRIL